MKRESESVAEIQLLIITRPQGIHGSGNFFEVLLDFWPACGRKNQDGELPATEILLMLQVLVRCDQRLKTVRLRHANEFTILQIVPALLERGYDGMPGQRVSKWGGRSLVEEDFHPRSALFGDREALACEFQYRFDLRLRDARKPFEKFADRRAVFEVVEQRLHRDARAVEKPSAADLAGHTFNH